MDGDVGLKLERTEHKFVPGKKDLDRPTRLVDTRLDSHH
jgi:hypothetical protein